MSTNVGSIHYDLGLDKSKFDKASNEVVDKLKGLTTKLALIGTAAATAFAGNTVRLAVNLEQTNVAFETMLGSADKAKTLMRDLSTFAAKTPFEINEIRDTAKQLLAYGISEEKIIDTSRMLGDVASGLGKHTFPQLTLAFGQVKAKGKLMGQELLQLTNAGFNVAESLGMTRGELMELMATEEGVSFEMLEQGFKKVTGEGGRFFNLMDKQSKTIGGRWSNLKDKFTLFSEALGLKVLPVLASLFESIERLNSSESFRAFIGNVVEIAKQIATLAQQVAEYLMPKLSNLWTQIKENVIPALQNLWQSYLEPLTKVLGVTLVIALGFFIDALAFLADKINWLLPILASFGGMMLGWQVLGAIDKVKVAIIMQGGLQAALMNFGAWLKGAASAGGLLITPWGAIAAVAIGAFVAIQSGAQRTIQVLDDLANKINKNNASNEAALRSANASWKAGRITTEQYKAILFNAQPRATGGLVSANQPYMVGERGPELYIPQNSGSIISNSDLMNMLSNQGGNSVTTNFNAPINIARTADANEVMNILSRNMINASQGMIAR